MKGSLELIPVPVVDVDRAKAFYAGALGFAVDHDTRIGRARIVQLTPEGSGCSIAVDSGFTAGAPGSVQGLQLVVDDVAAARAELVAAGAEPSELFHYDGTERVPGHGGRWNAFVTFADPDGNGWVLQERPAGE